MWWSPKTAAEQRTDPPELGPCLYIEPLQILSNTSLEKALMSAGDETVLIVCMCWGLVSDTNSVLPISFLAFTRGLKWNCGI